MTAVWESVLLVASEEACPANNIKSNTILKEYKGLIWIAAKGVMLAVLLYFLLLKQS